VTLTGLGERVHLATPSVDLDTHITDVVNLLDYEGLEDAVLLGHSYAGVVITGVADRRPDRLSSVVYLDTGPLPDGVAIVDVQSPEQREQQQRAVRERGDGWRWPVPDRDTLVSGLFGSVSGLQESHLRALEEWGTAQPYATFTSPLRLAGGQPRELRRVAVFCSAGGMDLATLRLLIEQRDPRCTSCPPGTGRCCRPQARSPISCSRQRNRNKTPMEPIPRGAKPWGEQIPQGGTTHAGTQDWRGHSRARPRSRTSGGARRRE
jgi:pimeloyl-ACP methyl ester carboxylesterase